MASFGPPDAAARSLDGTAYKTMATLVCLDMPVGAEFGIDMNAWTTGEKFRGVKFIPTGTHLVYYAAAPEGIRSALFVHAAAAHVIVAKWNKSTEMLDFPGDIDELNALQDHVKDAVHRFELDSYLGPYPSEQYGSWQKLTKHISREVIARIQPIGQRFQQEAGTAAEGGEEKKAPKIFFSCIPGVGAGSKPEDRTQYAIDTSSALSTIVSGLSKHGNATQHYVGELEASYVLFVMAQSFDALEQWKHMLDVICRCEDTLQLLAACERSDMVTPPSPSSARKASSVDMLELLLEAYGAAAAQLSHLPTDLFTSDLSKKTFLHTSLHQLYRTSQKLPDGPLKSATARLIEFASARFRFDFAGHADAGNAITPDVPISSAIIEAAGDIGDGCTREFASVEELLAALREEGGDDDLPTILSD